MRRSHLLAALATGALLLVAPVASVCLEAGASPSGCHDHCVAPSPDCAGGPELQSCCPPEPAPAATITASARQVKPASDLAVVQAPVCGDGREAGVLGAGRMRPPRTHDPHRYKLLSSYLL